MSTETMDRLWSSGDDPVCHLSIIFNSGELTLLMKNNGEFIQWEGHWSGFYKILTSFLLEENQVSNSREIF